MPICSGESTSTTRSAKVGRSHVAFVQPRENQPLKRDLSRAGQNGAAAVGDMRVEGVPDLGEVEMRNSGPNAITY